MKSTKNTGIWMDHSIAYIIEVKENAIVSNTIESESHIGKKQNYGKDESLKHNKEQNHLSDYFSKLGNHIKNYENVLLFGPTNAKNELYNLLKEDQQFDKIKFKVESADKLTENQMLAFVKEHFDHPKK